MIVSLATSIRRRIRSGKHLRWALSITLLAVMLLTYPAVALAQVGGSPFESGFTALQTLFTGTIAKVASLIAIVVGGYTFAHGEPGAKKNLAGVAAGTGIAVLATNILSWLWGM
jgi:type IV secretion system protein VirB2